MVAVLGAAIHEVMPGKADVPGDCVMYSTLLASRPSGHCPCSPYELNAAVVADRQTILDVIS